MDPKEIYGLLEAHTKTEEARFSSIEDSVSRTGEKVDRLMTNHVAHLAADVSSIKADMKWLKWAVMLVFGTVIAGYFNIPFVK